MNKVTESLYIGPGSAGANEQLLRQYGITHIVSIKYKDEADFPRFKGICYLPIENLSDTLMDTDVPTFRALHPVVTAFINAAEGKVLVHCVSGVSRSAAFCVAYLMGKHGLGDPYEGLSLLEKCRECVSPAEEFLEVLMLTQQD